MAIGLKEKKFGTLLLIVLVGILIGSYLNSLIGIIIPGENSVVKTFFTYNFIPFGIGFPKPVIINLDAIQFQVGIQIKFSLLSILGIFLSLYFFRWYR